MTNEQPKPNRLNRFDHIRNEEKKYHDFCYENYKLFKKGSWLYKPVKTVLDLLPMFAGKQTLNVLDLGSGVGRNSIPIAQAMKEMGINDGQVVCVDLLDSALQKLTEYSEQYGVADRIIPEKADIGDYQIKRDSFDFIVAVSSIEHVQSVEVLDNVLYQMEGGTRKGGINCIVINSEVEEIEMDTNKKIDALMEVNVSTDVMLSKLQQTYREWELLHTVVKPLEYIISRNGQQILLKTNAITYVVRKN